MLCRSIVHDCILLWLAFLVAMDSHFVSEGYHDLVSMNDEEVVSIAYSIEANFGCAQKYGRLRNQILNSIVFLPFKVINPEKTGLRLADKLSKDKTAVLDFTMDKRDHLGRKILHPN